MEKTKAQALQAYVLAFALLITPSLAIFLPRALASLFVLAVMACLPILRHPRSLRWPPRSILVVLGAFHLWQAVSILWCLDPAQAIRSTLGMIGLSLGGSILLATMGALPEKSLRLILRAATLGFLVGAVIFAIDAIWGSALREVLYPLLAGKTLTSPFPPQRLNRASTVMALMALPVGYALLIQRRWVLFGLTVAAAASTVMLSPSSTAKICLILGPLVALGSWLAARPLALALRTGLVITVISFPFAMNTLSDTQSLWNHFPSIPHSTHHRLSIWKFTADKVMEKPILGWGMDSSRSIPGGDDEVLVYPPSNKLAFYHEQNLPLHPHNTALQWWLELGAVGATLGLTILLTIITVLQPLPTPYRAISLGLLTQAVTVAFISFGAWQAWWLAVLWLIALLIFAVMRLYPQGNPATDPLAG